MDNILQFLKYGGIHIKKKNAGKFTDYCNGKVTLECINKGKHSSNPITRKRAVFADNARHWVKKGLRGLTVPQVNIKGANLISTRRIVKAEEGAKTGTFQKIGNFLNSDTGKSIVSGITSIGSAIVNNKKLSDSADLAKSGIDLETSQKKELARKLGYNLALSYLASMLNPDNPNAYGGDIFQLHFANQYANQFTLGIDEDAETKKAEIDLLTLLLQTEALSGAINSFAETGMGLLLNYLNKPKNNVSVGNSVNTSKNNISVSNSGNKSTITTNIGGVSTSNTYNIPKVKTPTLEFKSNLAVV